MIERNETAILVDMGTLSYSAFFAFGVLTHNGDATGVIFGTFKKILDLAERFNTNRFYFAWDHKINFRENFRPTQPIKAISN